MIIIVKALNSNSHEYIQRRTCSMLLMIIFALIALLGGYGTISALKNKNILGAIFGAGSFLVFGWFAVMTVINDGFPPTL